MHSSKPQPQPRSQFKLKAGIAIALTAIPIVTAGILMATNPTEQAYSNYALETACGFQNLPQQLQDACKNTVGTEGGFWGRDRLKSLIISQTQRQNFVLFSLYKTEVFGQTYTSVGVLGRFVPLGVQGS